MEFWDWRLGVDKRCCYCTRHGSCDGLAPTLSLLMFFALAMPEELRATQSRCFVKISCATYGEELVVSNLNFMWMPIQTKHSWESSASFSKRNSAEQNRCRQYLPISSKIANAIWDCLTEEFEDSQWWLPKRGRANDLCGKEMMALKALL